MSGEKLRIAITATPFQTFTLNIADGRSIPVVGRDFILLSPRGRTVTVYQKDESKDQGDMLLVTGMSFAPPPAEVASKPSDTEA